MEQELEEPLILNPKKGFGQHFLVQASAIRAITGATLACAAPRILEIGPGAGVLTGPLLEDGRPLWAVELDPEAIAVLEQRFRGEERFHLLAGDAVRIALPEGPPFTVVGNLPYNASTAILTRFLVEPLAWERLVFMFQLEVAQKITGRPGTKDYGPLSILAQTTCRVTRILKLGRGAFQPPPKVDSAVLLFEPLEEAPPLAIRPELLAFLHRSFNHRRKTLANNWQGWLSTGQIQTILASQGLGSAIRAEAIPPRTWLNLFRALQGKGGLPLAPIAPAPL